MVNVMVDVAKVVLAAGAAVGIIIVATKVDAEGAKVVLNTAAGNHIQNLGVLPIDNAVLTNCQPV